MSLYYRRLRKLEGYHFGVLCCAVVAAVVFIINLLSLIWAISRFGVQNGLGTLQDGSCKKTSNLIFWIHLAINILSTLLLGGSNYSMQCLASPTRNEIDKAHSKGVWLDIGVPSVRNLWRVSRIRLTLWCSLAISSVPLHLLYNSAVFSSLGGNQYNAFLVSSDFLDGAPFSTSTFELDSITANVLQDYQKNPASLTKLSDKACVEIYTAQIVSAYSDLVLISDYSDSNNSLLYYGAYEVSESVSGPYSTSGTCSLNLLSDCDPSGIIAHDQNWSVYVNCHGDCDVSAPSSINGTSIQYCLSKHVDEHCTLQFSLAIMIIVIICNLIKTICMSIIVWKQDPEPLVTLGDAIASFLDQPDVTTEGKCILDKTQFQDKGSWRLLKPCSWDPKRVRWFRAASRRRWLLCNTL